eukprot:CAMPEP_0172440140 /NCGR_PEP_ID=MMETSP1065-20121228/884_1 /TAXON_ID=265537 /ORGANISM="Amphiprora paludosa, Strain CCMP125" /LENGTH=136 /DNA_ID=CAMNT_0013188923 /DNA_START=141 /DNA_END=551 /DNA_ORIENTATION=-
MFHFIRPSTALFKSTATTTSVARAACPAAAVNHGNDFFQQQKRGNFQIALSQRRDRKTGKMVYDEWHYLIRGVQVPSYKDGRPIQTAVMQRRKRGHMKKSKLKVIAANKKVYDRDAKKVDDLLAYIKFMEEHGFKN